MNIYILHVTCHCCFKVTFLTEKEEWLITELMSECILQWMDAHYFNKRPALMCSVRKEKKNQNSLVVIIFPVNYISWGSGAQQYARPTTKKYTCFFFFLHVLCIHWNCVSHGMCVLWSPVYISNRYNNHWMLTCTRINYYQHTNNKTETAHSIYKVYGMTFWGFFGLEWYIPSKH